MTNSTISTIPVVIPYYLAEESLKKCVSALEASNYQPLEIFIRDNSCDNILFTAAINEGLRKFSYDTLYKFILVLNQDAFVHSNTVELLIDVMDKNPTCGIACPIQVKRDESGFYWAGSYEAFPLGRHKYELDSNEDMFETYWANGAAMLLRTSMIREIGLLDENMKFICSDSDYSFTARSRGWKIFVSSKARVTHSSGTSGISSDSFITKQKILDAIYFGEKWLSGDLYKRLSYEGGGLSSMRIKDTIKNFRSQLGKVS